MTVRFEVVPSALALDEDVRAQLLALWVDVTDSGGSVGFAAPAPVERIEATLRAQLRDVASGRDALGVLRAGDGHPVGMGLLVGRDNGLFAHWRTVLRVMVHPSRQGQGAGRVLMEGLHDAARGLGLEHLHLSVRGGEGLEAFYERFGYVVTGVHPDAVRLAPDDTRDEVFLVAAL